MNENLFSLGYMVFGDSVACHTNKRTCPIIARYLLLLNRRSMD